MLRGNTSVTVSSTQGVKPEDTNPRGSPQGQTQGDLDATPWHTFGYSTPFDTYVCLGWLTA